MNAVTLVAFLLGWAFGVHIPIVYTVLGVVWMLPTFELIGYRRRNEAYTEAVKNILHYLIAIYAVGGVFGTIVTVFLAGMLPVFTNVAGVLLWPFWAIAIAFGVAISLPLIGFYDRTFGSMKPANHIALGYIMASFTTVIPLMFRLIFAVVNYPAGIVVTKDASSLIGFDLSVSNFSSVLANPTYPPLAIATIAGAIALANVLIASVYDFRGRSGQPSYYGVVSATSKRVALASGFVSALGGLWYLYEVYMLSPTMAWSILGSKPAYLPNAFAGVYAPTYILTAPFAFAVGLAVALAATLSISLKLKGNRVLSAFNAVAGLAIVVIMEEVNLLAHLPYAIVPPLSAAQGLAAEYGVSFAVLVANTLKASTFATTLNALLDFVNADPLVLYISVAIYAAFTVIVVYGVYLALSWRRNTVEAEAQHAP